MLLTNVVSMQGEEGLGGTTSTKFSLGHADLEMVMRHPGRNVRQGRGQPDGKRDCWNGEVVPSAVGIEPGFINELVL